MEYKLLESLYYKNKDTYNYEYEIRYNGVSTVRLDIEINNNKAFFVITPEILNKTAKIYELNDKLNTLTNKLPGIALEQYIKNCLIDEIALTNEIEGVVSTRRNITEVIENINTTKEHKRLHGLVNKYLKLNSDEAVSLRSCQDIRDIYDELLWEEISEENLQNLPDGVYFRKHGVDVKSKYEKVIHKGIMPEDNINRTMQKALDILNDDKINILLRISIFHYLFGYIHPFYDGNGRTSRFISSYLLSKNLNTLTGYRLAYVVKENISDYYKSFKIVNSELNKGDITPFIINFLDIIIKVFEKLQTSVSEKTDLLKYYRNITGKMSSDASEKNVIFAIFQETLFGYFGISISDMKEIPDLSEYKIRSTVKALAKKGLLKMNKLGRKPYYVFDMDTVKKQYE